MTLKIVLLAAISLHAFIGCEAPARNTPSGTQLEFDGTAGFAIDETEVARRAPHVTSETMCGLIENPHTVVPAFRGGRVIGIRVFSVRYGSLGESIGLQNGDTILRVNDIDFSRPGNLRKLHESLGACEHVIVDVERKGQLLRASYGNGEKHLRLISGQ